MPRPVKQRMVLGRPPATVYKPAGVPARHLQWMHLRLDEFEAIRLVDGCGIDQETAARHMGVSRPTVTRILASARAKIARTFIQGQALVIEGGPVVQAPVGTGPPLAGGWGRGGMHGRRRGGPGRHGMRHGNFGPPPPRPAPPQA